jgi:hypothetical protein
VSCHGTVLCGRNGVLNNATCQRISPKCYCSCNGDGDGCATASCWSFG